ncbi:histidine kinase [Flavobacterium piscis]|jgi:two-component system LytT family sensor kinase|uniref:Histidine kinase n=1 Tax=Flavobacterium piscis TaxID=1114874 RepID=A0ABX2XBA1_9FLAO|nr:MULTISPECIES: sensor histidine kinase [Flavobacterium]OCB68443.1 histidine kinase [Flavobacterium piscis]OXG06011.1 histidine kinase [Flavobacterium piscis]QDW20164.1 histidine kinase [Flavobacterium sp. KBS0721]
MTIDTIRNTSSNKILFHCIIWVFFILTSLIQFYESPFRINNDFYVQWATGIILFYLNYFYLVPVLLLEKKYWLYFVFVFALILLFMIIRINYFIPDFSQVRQLKPSNIMHTIPPEDFKLMYKGRRVRAAVLATRQPLFFKIGPSFFYILIITISAIIRTLTEFYNNQQNKLIAETHRTNTELIYLRKQTNPHFLFNSLNSIYSLAHKKSDLVPDAIVTLSELMRYMLYETDNKTVALEKEVNYIQNYIELQKLRLNNIEDIIINVHGDTRNKFIEPLLLISFVENAFKYGTDYKGAAHVKIKIFILENSLDFWIENTIENYIKDPENSGIGLVNIQNRLDLLYPNAHELNITQDNQYYRVHLNLKLDKIQTAIN